jgi:hypothetical protein
MLTYADVCYIQEAADAASATCSAAAANFSKFLNKHLGQVADVC